VPKVDKLTNPFAFFSFFPPFFFLLPSFFLLSPSSSLSDDDSSLFLFFFFLFPPFFPFMLFCSCSSSTRRINKVCYNKYKSDIYILETIQDR
jgi:hypothetical protein